MNTNMTKMEELDLTARAVEFFTSWFDGCTGDVEFVAIAPDAGPKDSLWVRGPNHEWTHAVRWALEQSDKQRNVYFTPATHRPGTEGHRRKETAYELPGLFADVDFKGMGQEAVIQHLEANGSADRVTIIVNSGGGFHPYAKFEKPVMVDQVGRQGLEQYLYAFGAFLAGGRGPERFDLASILRVPGTVNYPDTRKRKQGRQASPTEVCDCIESRFGLTDFDDLLARFPHQAPAAPAPGNGSVEIGTIPSDWHEVLSKDAQLQDLWDGKGKTQGDTSPSGYSMALARRLVEENGYSGAEMLAIMQAHYQHMGQPPKSPSSLQTTLGKAKVSPGKNSEHPNPWSRARSVREFVNSGTPTVAWLHPLLLAKGYLTQMFSPRGIGKTLVAHLIARKLVAEGRRVLLLDRDNPEGEVRRRLVSVGAGAADGLKVMTRHEVPSLTDQQAWKSFPATEYDAIIVDSLDSSAEGVGEKDSAKPSKAIAALLDIAHGPNGPAVLVLGNTVKSGEHSRGCGVIEDRGDIVYEVRDATDFQPKTAEWWTQLPAAGAGAWGERAARRRQRTTYRLAFIASKFRLGSDPDPFILEVDLTTEPWTLRDVTAEVHKGVGEAQEHAERQQEQKEDAALQALHNRVLVGQATGKPLRSEADAVPFLMERGLTRERARGLLKDNDGGLWRIEESTSRGAPRFLLPLIDQSEAGTGVDDVNRLPPTDQKEAVTGVDGGRQVI